MAVGGITARAGVVALAALTIAACAKKDNYATDTTAVSSTTVTDIGMAPASTTATRSSGLSDANIAYILDQANMADSVWGAIAATKATSANVRDFARTMMRDHHALRKMGEDLVKKLALTPTPPAGDSSQTNLTHVGEMLNNTPKGKDFDKAYIDHEVDYHKAVLQTATTAMSAAQNTELKNLIQKAAPTIQGHLDRAEKLQKSMK